MNYKNKLHKIKAFVFDFDGVMKYVRNDYLLSGMGICFEKYKLIISSKLVGRMYFGRPKWTPFSLAILIPSACLSLILLLSDTRTAI